MAIVYKIHPAIGTARVGNSPEYYLARKRQAGCRSMPRPASRSIAVRVCRRRTSIRCVRRLKKQAARFKVYAYDDANPAVRVTRVQVGTTKAKASPSPPSNGRCISPTRRRAGFSSRN
jgi:hypothetical protein